MKPFFFFCLSYIPQQCTHIANIIRFTFTSVKERKEKKNHRLQSSTTERQHSTRIFIKVKKKEQAGINLLRSVYIDLLMLTRYSWITTWTENKERCRDGNRHREINQPAGSEIYEDSTVLALACSCEQDWHKKRQDWVVSRYRKQKVCGMTRVMISLKKKKEKRKSSLDINLASWTNVLIYLIRMTCDD